MITSKSAADANEIVDVKARAGSVRVIVPIEESATCDVDLKTGYDRRDFLRKLRCRIAPAARIALTNAALGSGTSEIPPAVIGSLMTPSVDQVALGS